jgi:hypothetical protein
VQQFKAFCRHCGLEGCKARKVATGMIQALNKADLNRVRTERKDNWNRLGRGLGGNG